MSIACISSLFIKETYCRNVEVAAETSDELYYAGEHFARDQGISISEERSL
jgi:hypothetical protein